MKTSSGREVSLVIIHIRPTYLEILEGGASESMRKMVLGELPWDAKRHLGGELEDLFFREPPVAPHFLLPHYAFFAEFKGPAIEPKAHFSTLRMAWLDDNLPENLPVYLATQIATVDWEKHARDGWI